MRFLHAVLADHAARAPHKLAVADGSGTLTRSQFLQRIADFMRALPDAPATIGLLAPNGVDAAAAQLAAAFSGKTVVPLPTFFSAGQIEHIVRDASIGVIWTSTAYTTSVAGHGLPVLPLVANRLSGDLIFAEGFRQIIYTSGTTGQPKGVRHGAQQIAWMTRALAAATEAKEDDLYLSVLPLPLLLETICAVFAPALVGGAVRFAPVFFEAVGRGIAPDLVEIFERTQPTMSVLVPQLLKTWVAQLARAGRRAPASLRFVAVGGAPTPTVTAAAAWRLGAPIFEGYGLSECCSVVALNRIGERVEGAVGRPLPGLDVRIVDGEIVVDGPSVTDGYLGAVDHAGPWRTGDLGALDEDGRLRVRGRKDNVLVTSMGRNVSPEWIETMLLADLAIAQCALTADAQGDLAMIVIPSAWAAEALTRASPDETIARVREACAEAPEYARPLACFVVPAPEALGLGLLNPTGRISRPAAAAFARANPHMNRSKSSDLPAGGEL